jgi:hypothetical protein
MFMLIPLAWARQDDSTNLPTEVDNKLTFSGYIDGSYNYLVNDNHFISNVYDRVNDIQLNGYSLQQFAVTALKDPAHGFGGLLNVVLGLDANTMAPQGLNPNMTGMQNIGLTIPQAYLQFRSNPWTIQAGAFSSLSGLESYAYPLDTNFSRSLLDGFANAGEHVGIRLFNQINDQWALIVGSGNGWSTIRDIQRQTSIEYAVQYIKNDVLTFTFDGYTSERYLSANLLEGPTSYSTLFDIFGTYALTPQLSLAMNYDYGWQNKAIVASGAIQRATWQAVAGYINYHLTDDWFTSVRGEFYSDPEGYTTGVKQSLRELTFSLACTKVKNLLIRAETRHDISNNDSFFRKNNNGTRNFQQSFAFDVLYQF